MVLTKNMSSFEEIFYPLMNNRRQRDANGNLVIPILPEDFQFTNDQFEEMRKEASRPKFSIGSFRQLEGIRY